MRDIPVKGEKYRHFKGNDYEIYFPVKTPEKIFARPLTMFMSEVDHEKYPNAGQEYRFEKIADAPDSGYSENDDEGLESVPPLLLEFLDADTYADKLVIFDRMKNSITDEMIDAIAVSLDTEVDKLPLEERYRQIKDILLMHESYETTRLRG